MARTCFEWLCRRLQFKSSGHARLIALKNSAYAWRQMLFYLSVAAPAETIEFLNWSDGLLAKQPAPFREKFQPAWRGLMLAARGQAWPQDLTARSFLAWSRQHWLY
jgi:hypothetical protein